MSEDQIDVLAIEDNRAYMQNILNILEMNSRLNCVGHFYSAEKFLSGIKQTPVQADVALLDLGLPGNSGMTLIPFLNSMSKGCRVLVITQNNDYRQTLEAIRLGVSGYILKNSPVHEVERAIVEVYSGGCVIDPRLCGYVLEAMESKKQHTFTLSQGEHRILELLAMGYSKKEVADHLNLSYSRISQATQLVFKKLKAPNVAAAVATAIRKGII